MFFLMMVLWAQLWSPCRSRISSFSHLLGCGITKPSADGFRPFQVTGTLGMFWHQGSYFCNLSLILFWIYQESVSRKYQGRLRWLSELYEDWYAGPIAEKNTLNRACCLQNLNQLWYFRYLLYLKCVSVYFDSCLFSDFFFPTTTSDPVLLILLITI